MTESFNISSSSNWWGHSEPTTHATETTIKSSHRAHSAHSAHSRAHSAHAHVSHRAAKFWPKLSQGYTKQCSENKEH
ncbi:unnamed protein product [Haemonchus placei]|uniref:Uncharacterized protein n=1 Tax=Haemonchus placei TaxID=6290 RepID=A0A0N4X5Z0_HAEPC|nr:unnamed protein product [Haemonchus placei]